MLSASEVFKSYRATVTEFYQQQTFVELGTSVIRAFQFLVRHRIYGLSSKISIRRNFPGEDCDATTAIRQRALRKPEWAGHP